MDLIVFFTAVAHLLYTPFTKVEESFNIQAIHDILYLRNNFTEYDHHEFPGVVPRTFIGALFVSIISSPVVIIFEYFQIQKFWTQYVVRLVIATIITISWNHLKTVIEKRFGFLISMWFILITVSQFHFMFYMSRPLPNIMALPLVLSAVTYWLKQKHKLFIWLSGAAVIIFRVEVAIFLGLFLLHDLYFKKITMKETLKTATLAGVILLSATIIVDSFFWNRLLWPEGEVLWFNTILNKSSNWGVSPFLWYFYSAIPRAMGSTLFFVPYGLYIEPRCRPLGVAAIFFVFLYSFLPHKELRFIIYVFPFLNFCAACGCHRIWINKGKTIWQAGLSFIVGGHLILNAFLTIFLLIVSGTNYPGGIAMSRFHRLASNDVNISVHICNLAAQSGVSRFMQVRSDWIYNKAENLTYTDEELQKFDYLLIEAKIKYTNDWHKLMNDYDLLEFIECFNNIGFQYNSFVPIRIKTKPCIGIMKRKFSATKYRRIDSEQKQHFIDDEISTERFNENIRNKFDNDIFVQTQNNNGDNKNNVIDNLKSVFIQEHLTKLSDYTSEEMLEEIEFDNQRLEKSEFVVSNNNKHDKNDDSTENDDENDLLSGEEVYEEPAQRKYAYKTTYKTKTDQEIKNQRDSTFDSDDHDDEHDKEINFQELRNLALGKLSRNVEKSTKAKLRRVIENYYQSKGSVLESQHYQIQQHHSKKNVRTSIKNIIKQEKIKEIVEKISKIDITKFCNLDNLTAKECLKQVIENIDDDENNEK